MNGKKNLIFCIILFALACGCAYVKIHAQSVSAKSDLISAFRQDATALLKVRADIRKHRAAYDALGFTFVDGDFTGANQGITQIQFTSAVTNLTDVCDKFDLGGTLAAGIPTGVNRIAFVGN